MLTWIHSLPCLLAFSSKSMMIYCMDVFTKAKCAAEFVSEKSSFTAEWGIVLGTGLGGMATQLRKAINIPYKEIPYFPMPSSPSHSGEFIGGYLGDVPVWCLSGRFHYYEGYDMKEVTHPIRTLSRLGVNKIIISNAAGGTNENYNTGDIVVLKDHINLMPENPLRGPNDERLGVRFLDMSEGYDLGMREKVKKIGKDLDLNIAEGTYTALPGPNLETKAEYQFVHRIGGDLVGMSTVPEVLVARHEQMRVCVLSVVANVCYPPERVVHTTAEDVIKAVNASTPAMEKIVTELINSI